jgi:hypothetical protein
MKKTNSTLEILFWTLLVTILATGIIMLMDVVFGMYTYLILISLVPICLIWIAIQDIKK